MKTNFLLFLTIISSCLGWKFFHRGRGKGGNLKEPFYNNNIRLPSDEWFTQVLDHFNPTNTGTWQQRFFTNSTYYTAGGPVFLMIGGEGTASPKWMVQGTWLTYAKQFKALCLQLEHRYYGKSHPTKDLSVKNLIYLSSEQALADLANFIVSTNERLNLPPGTKWITFGGSYPGSLSAWMRLKYPHLVAGAMSASGPLLAVADFKDYYAVVEESLRSSSANCVNVLEDAKDQLQELMSHQVGQQTVAKMFKLCDTIDPTIEQDISNLYENLASNFAGIVQYDKDNRDFEGARGVNITIEHICTSILRNESIGTAIRRVALVNEELLQVNNQSCLDFKYDKMVSELSNTSWEAETSEGGRQWTYQTCTEFGFFQTSALNVTQSLFGSQFPVDFFFKQCVDIFGPNFNSELLSRAIQRTNMMYGALDIHTSNVVFVHGSEDPWHALGITQTLTEGSPAIYIQGTAHCANMYPSSPLDLPQLTEARQRISNLIGTWLQQ